MKSLPTNNLSELTAHSYCASPIAKTVTRSIGGSALIKLAAIMAAVIICLACASVTSAQVLRQRVFVSADSGTNAGSCPLASPCKTFAYAVNHVTPGGEVIVLSSGGYGAVNITKALIISAPAGVYAGIIADTAGQNAVTIAAGVNDSVTLRGLALNGLGGDNGVLITQAGSVHIENCVISSFDGLGLNGMGIKLTAAAKLYVKDTIVRDNNHSGIYVEPAVGTIAQVFVDNTRAENNGLFGIYFFARTKGSISRSVTSGGAYGIHINNGNSVDAADGSVAMISNCVTSQNGTDGIVVNGVGSKAVAQESTASAAIAGFRASGGADLTVAQCVAHNNGFAGVVASDSATIARVSNSTITNNNFGFYQSNTAVFESRGNNTVRANAIADSSGVITPILGL